MHKDGLRRAGTALLIGLMASLALTGCAAGSGETARTPASTASAGQVQPGAALRTGAQTNEMAAQYALPRPGPVAAAGASAWVPPAPPPAFTVTGLPPAAPPAPPPAVAANRQPEPSAPRPAVDASQIVRPEAATPDTPASQPASTATRDEGRRLFADYSCNACHALADAGAAGAIGPSLDNPSLTHDFVVEVVTSGRGAMPSFAGQMSDEEIATLATYIVGSARR